MSSGTPIRLADAVRRRDLPPDLIVELAPVAAEVEQLADAERSLDELSYAGVFLTANLRGYKVSYASLDLDGRGHPVRTNHWKTFRRGELHDVGGGEFAGALEAARLYKQQRTTEVALGRARVREVTLDDAFAEFMSPDRHRATTAANYTYAYDRHIRPKLGRWALNALTVDVVGAWYDDLEAGPEAKSRAGRLLRAIVRDALRRGRIATDPTRVLRIAASSVRRLEPDEVPTADDVWRLADAAGDRDRALVLVLGFAGLRLGEALALRVRDVSLDGVSTISVARTVEETSDGLVYAPPKTARGRRTIAIPAFLADELRRHLEAVRPEADVDELLFVTARGDAVRPTNWRNRVWRSAARAAGVRVTPHALRHAAASALIDLGASAVDVAQALGDDPRVVLAVYAHAFESGGDELARLLDEAHRRAGNH
jgi:integrase